MRRVFSSIIVAFVAIIGVGVLVFEAGWLTTDVKTEQPAPPAHTLTPDEQAYYEFAAPRLRQAAAEATFLADLGESRSRNFFELQDHRSKLTALINEVTQYTAEHGVPDRFAEVDRAFREGAAISLRAMRDAIDAFTNFQFATFAEIVPRFREGANLLELAATRLDTLGGASSGTPVSS